MNRALFPRLVPYPALCNCSSITIFLILVKWKLAGGGGRLGNEVMVIGHWLSVPGRQHLGVSCWLRGYKCGGGAGGVVEEKLKWTCHFHPLSTFFGTRGEFLHPSFDINEDGFRMTVSDSTEALP